MVPHAMMFDEDAPREIVPSVSLQVNEEPAATVPAGTPLWFTVGVKFRSQRWILGSPVHVD
jgi:hypothetical protein